jgi:phage gp46-like protein
MFDVATRPQPLQGDAAQVFGLPFDWRLTQPSPAAEYPWWNYASSTGVPEKYVDMLQTYALELEDTLQTAVIISLFTDARAGRDDKLPLNQADRRGWVGDEFMVDDFDGRPDPWGSKLWLVYISKTTADVLEAARFSAQECLAWMVRAGIASRVDVTAQWAGERMDRLALRVAIYRPGQAQPVYDVLWGTTFTRSVQ